MGDEEDKIDLRKEKILAHLWECRNFELTLLWQRSAFLGVFLTLIYTGYALLWGDNLYGDLCRLRFNMMGAILTLVGVIVSLLWVAMMRGSKAWYEVYESAITAFVGNDTTSETKGMNPSVRGFGVEEIKGFPIKFMQSNSKKFLIFSLEKGAYSPSRILILIGWLSCIGFAVAFSCHVFNLIVRIEYSAIMKLLSCPVLRAICSIVITILVVVVAKKTLDCSLHSKRLEELMTKNSNNSKN